MASLLALQPTASLINSPRVHTSPIHGLQSCSSMSELKQFHSQIIRLGLSIDNDAMGRLIKFCAVSKNGDLDYALLLFKTIPYPDAFIYNTLIRGCLQQQSSRACILLYLQMLHKFVLPNKFTFPSLIRACCIDNAVEEGKQVHAHVFKFGFRADRFSQNNLIHMYANFQCLEDARRVFDGIELPDAVAWTTLLTGYAQCGFVDEAFQVFESMPEHSSTSWNAMISSFVQNNRFHEAFALFNRMRSEKIVLDKYVAASMLSACTGLGALEQGKWIHRYIKKSGIELDSKLATTLIDMYCKCGCLDCAFLVFTNLPEKGISSWNCMIGGMAMHGRGEAAIELFKEMEMKMVAPDNITFLNVLSACAHSGLVEEGRHYFRHFIELYGIEPRTEHFGCMVDLYGRAGMLEEALKLISNMPMNPDAGVLGALVGACKIHGDVDLGEEIGKRVIELEPNNSGRYVLLGNLYAEAGRWEGVAEVRKLMNDREVKKAPGFSMIELEGIVYEFIAGGRAHPEAEEIYVKVNEMLECIRVVGYVPENEIDVEKDNPIYYHSEKLAVAFGLLKTKAGETLRITKNLRICKDCHQALKLVSKVFERKIIVRDRNRFHHFYSGECSCNDYWYTSTHANKKIELFGERGINEPTTDDNIEMTSSLSSQELINVGKKTMDDTDPAIEHSKMVAEQTVEVGRQSASILEGQATAMKKIIAICQSGGEFVKNKDGSLSYNGGEAYAIDIDQQTNLDDFKTEVAEMFNCSIDTMSIKYFLPGNKRTLISISKDKDLKRMVNFLRDSITVDVFILSEEAAARNLSNMPASRSSRTTVSEAVVPVVEPVDVAVENIIAIDQIGMDISSEVPLICVPAGSTDEKHRKAAQQWENAIIGVDQRFNSFSEFREALHKYSVAHGFAYRYKKNDSHRVTVKCKYQGCPWRIYASRLSTTQLICIKKMNTSHSCEGAAAKAGYRATRGWVGNIIKEKLKVSPNYKPKDIADDIKREYGIQLNYSQAWRAKEIAREQLQGSYKEAYNQLPYFCDKIKETNPGSVASFTTKDDSSFHRLFVSFNASISGFQQGCRPLLFLDSTPLNSKYQGVFLTATAADGEDGIFPAAFAVVDAETEENWHWFLLELKSAVQTSEQITFVADFRNGLNKSLAEIFDKSYHSYCLRHLAEKLNNDLKGQFSHEARRFMINDFYAAALASKLEDFQRCAESIKGISPDAYNWIIQSEPEHWANAFFGGARYNHITSNFGQQFYCSVSEAHELPITQMIDVLRGKMMETIYRRRVESDQWMTKLTPSNEEKLQKEISIARSFQVLLSHGSTFEVRGESVDIVDVDHWDCSCKGWQLTGLPCCHAIAVFQCIGRSPYEYCSRYFTVDSYRLTYAESIHPVPNVDRPILGESTEALVTVTPPPTRRPPGRPKMRQNESLEVVKRQLQCSKCKGLGHNKKTCKDS